MMTATSIKSILAGKSDIDSIVTVQGWVRTRRDSKAGISFIQVHDGSCFARLQILAANNIKNYEDFLKITTCCAVAISGKLVASQGKGQAFEIQAENIEIVGWVDDPDTYPMAPKRHSMEYLRENAHLRPRTNTIGAVTRVRHVISQAIHQFLDQLGYYWIPTPIITASDCEGAGELFRVSTLDLANLPRNDKNNIDFGQDFFGRETFLTVSGQLNVETYCCALSKVYTFGPTFRAENSNTSRHLAEFWMVEPEIAFADLMDSAKLAEDMLKFLAKTVLDKAADDMEFFAERIEKDCITRLENIVNQPFEIVDYADAITLLEKSKKKFEFPVKWGLDLQSEHERYIAEEHFKKPVTIVNYPKDIKSFYMRMNDDGKTVAALDVLAPGIGEIIGGSQREERYDKLLARIKEMGLPEDELSWYLELRKFGSAPHSGFGLGFERLILFVTGMTNIRDVIPFPRFPGNAEY